jgi:hypothetical protein
MTLCSRVLCEELIVTQLIKKLAAFYGNRMFINVLRAPYPETDESSPQFPFLFP